MVVVHGPEGFQTGMHHLGGNSIALRVVLPSEVDVVELKSEEDLTGCLEVLALIRIRLNLGDRALGDLRMARSQESRERLGKRRPVVMGEREVDIVAREREQLKRKAKVEQAVSRKSLYGRQTERSKRTTTGSCERGGRHLSALNAG